MNQSFSRTACLALLVIFGLSVCEWAAPRTWAQSSANLGAIKQEFIFTADDGTDATLSDSLNNLTQGGSLAFDLVTIDGFSLNSTTAEGGATAIDPNAVTVTATLRLGELFLDFDGPFAVTSGQTVGIDFSYNVSTVLGINLTNLELDNHTVTGTGAISIDQSMEDDIAFFTLGVSESMPSTSQLLSAADAVDVSTKLLLSAAGGAGVIDSCDFTGDGQCDAADLDLLYANFGNAAFDVDGNGFADAADIGAWLSAASDPANPYLGGSKTFLLGDANLDGNVNSTDLGLLLNNFGDINSLKFGEGNLNGDANVDSTDLGLLLNNFGAMSLSATAVPEPDSLRIVVLMAAVVFLSRRRFFTITT